MSDQAKRVVDRLLAEDNPLVDVPGNDGSEADRVELTGDIEAVVNELVAAGKADAFEQGSKDGRRVYLLKLEDPFKSAELVIENPETPDTWEYDQPWYVSSTLYQDKNQYSPVSGAELEDITDADDVIAFVDEN